MLYGIEVDVIDVPFEILFITNRMLPKTTLPQCDFAIAAARDRSASLEDAGGEPALDQVPTIRKIGVSIGQCHDDVKVIGQYNHGIDRERMIAPGRDHCRA